MLDGEHRHEQKIDDDRLRRRRVRPIVDRLRYGETRDEADGIEEADEEHGVGRDPIEKRDQPPGKIDLAMNILAGCLDLAHGLLQFVQSRRTRPRGAEDAGKAAERPCRALDLSLRWA
jgi:hypothetical protein